MRFTGNCGLGAKTARIGVAVVAVSGACAASAAAEAPEFGRCVGHPGGKYANVGCTEAATGSGSYEWEPGPGPKPKFTESVSGEKAFKWKLRTNEEGVCTGESATGEYTGSKTVGHVKIVLTGCQWLGTGACGTIALLPMRGELGVYELGEASTKNKLGLKLTPEGAAEFAQFVCGERRQNAWRGGAVIVPIASNMMLAKETLKYVQVYDHDFGPPRETSEEQRPPSFVGEAPNPLESTSDGQLTDFVTMGWQMATKLVNEERLEANAAV